MVGGAVLPWAVVAVLVAFAGLCSAMEGAITRLSRARVEEMVRDGDRRGTRLRPIVMDKGRHFNVLLLLQTLAQATAVSVAVVVVLETTDGGWWPGLVTALVAGLATFVVVGVGARTLGRQHPYALAAATAPLARGLRAVFGGATGILIAVGNAITPGKGFPEGPFASEAELLEVVSYAEQRGVVDVNEREMIESVFELGDTVAREVMVPRTDMVWIEGGKTTGQALALALRSGFSRIPVIGEGVDDVVGIVYLKDLAARSQDPRGRTGRVEPVRVDSVMRPATFVPESKPVDQLLREMQAQRVHLAVVIDEYGGTAGLVTIEDILEEIVGEITDEYDNERAPVEALDDGRARVAARLSAYDLVEEFGIPATEAELADVDSTAGLMAQLLGRVPIPGGQVEWHGFRLTAEGASGRRHHIDTVLVERVDGAPLDLRHRVAEDGGRGEEGEQRDGATHEPPPLEDVRPGRADAVQGSDG